jgi:hypothetical protein
MARAGAKETFRKGGLRKTPGKIKNKTGPRREDLA